MSGAADRREDPQLVRACLEGDESAWSALLERYERYVWAIIRHYRAAEPDASDLFQAVWLDVYAELGRLRDERSLRSWIGSITAHRCAAWRRESRRAVARVAPLGAAAAAPAGDEPPPDLLEQLERDQRVREAVERLPERCRELVRMLFFTHPPRPYKQVAAELGLAVGSIGFVRARCLARLAKQLAREDLV